MLVQDIVVTVDMDDLSRDKYQKIIKTLKGFSCAGIDTHTYDSEDPNRDLTKAEKLKLLTMS